MIKYYDKKNTPKKFHYFYLTIIAIIVIIGMIISGMSLIAMNEIGHKISYADFDNYSLLFYELLLAIIENICYLITFVGLLTWKKYGLFFK